MAATPPIKMSRRLTDRLLLAIVAMTFSGCRLKRPDDVLSPKKMESVLYDYHMAQALVSELPKEEKFKSPAFYNWVYSHNKVSQESFERSLKWYTRFPKEFAKIYKRLSNRVEDEYHRSSKELAQIEKRSVDIRSGDSIDMWYLDRAALLNTSEYMDKMTFSISEDSTIYKGDTVVFSMKGTFVHDDSPVLQKAYISLSAEYNDSVYAVDTVVNESGPVSLMIVLSNKYKFSFLRGAVNYLDKTDKRTSFLVLSDISLMRYHEKFMAPEPADSVPAAELGADDGGGDSHVE